MLIGSEYPAGSFVNSRTRPSKILALWLSLLLVSCDRNETRHSTSSPTPNDQSRTKALRAASAVGYDGTKLQKQVDDVLAQKEKREKDLEKQLQDPERK